MPRSFLRVGGHKRRAGRKVRSACDGLPVVRSDGHVQRATCNVRRAITSLNATVSGRSRRYWVKSSADERRS